MTISKSRIDHLLRLAAKQRLGEPRVVWLVMLDPETGEERERLPVGRPEARLQGCPR